MLSYSATAVGVTLLIASSQCFISNSNTDYDGFGEFYIYGAYINLDNLFLDKFVFA